MNEDYLKSFRKAPDPQWLAGMQARLGKKERRQALRRYAFLSVFALVFAFGMLMTLSSPVRAGVLKTIENIAGLRFEITTDYPGEAGEPVNELEPQHLAWEEAREYFLSPLQLPTYMPEGYEREADINLYIWADGKPTLDIFWRKDGPFPSITLAIAQCQSDDPGCGMIVGEDTLEEITINGKPGVLLHGGWNADTQKYDPSGGISLMWRYDDNAWYWLLSDQSMKDELIKMAESVP